MKNMPKFDNFELTEKSMEQILLLRDIVKGITGSEGRFFTSGPITLPIPGSKTALFYANELNIITNDDHMIFIINSNEDIEIAFAKLKQLREILVTHADSQPKIKK